MSLLARVAARLRLRRGGPILEYALLLGLMAGRRSSPS